jgi:hypothetical protein
MTGRSSIAPATKSRARPTPTSASHPDRSHALLDALRDLDLIRSWGRATVRRIDHVDEIGSLASNAIHRFGARGGGAPVYAYVVEGASGCVVVDSTRRIFNGRALRARVDARGKPLPPVRLSRPSAHPA